MLDVYYVEDDEAIAQAVKDYLEQKECRVMVFPTAAGARHALEKYRPAVLLVDWNLPDGRGDVLCRWVRGRWENLPVIFLTVRGRGTGRGDWISEWCRRLCGKTF